MKRCIATLALLFVLLPAAAREVIPLDEGWRFFFRTENGSDNARIVSLPHTWNTDITGGGLFLRTAAIYQRQLHVPQAWRGERLFVKFYGVQSVGTLYVNGRHAGEHRGGATAFVFEITDLVRFGADNDLRMEVSNTWLNDVLPVSAEQNLYGGIYRRAELIRTDRTAVTPDWYGADGVHLCPTAVSDERVEGVADIRLAPPLRSGNCTVSLELTAPDGYRAFHHEVRARLDGRPVSIPFALDDPELWSPDRPALYVVTVRVSEGDSRDSLTLRTGFRSLHATPAGGFELNGQRLPLRGVTLYHDHPLSGGTPHPDDLETDLAFVRELGANAVRSAERPHDSRFYDRCDELGLLAWIELPLTQAPFLGDTGYSDAPRFEENGLRQLREIIAQHVNHPSVAMWGIFSCLRTRGDNPSDYVRSLHGEARRLDPTRPTVACSDQDGEINFITDLIVWRQNVGWEKGSPDDVRIWSAMLRRSWSGLCSGVAYGNEGSVAHQDPALVPEPRTNWLPESRQTRFHESYAKHLVGDSLFWGVWLNNLFDFGAARRPYGINASGLVTFDRRTRKDAFYLYRALWNRDMPTLRIADRRSLRADGTVRQLHVYAQERPLLLVDGDTVAVRPWASCQWLSDSVRLTHPCTLVATAGGLTDSVELRAGSAPTTSVRPDLRQRGGPRQID